MNDWSEWEPFPDPRNSEYLNAPFGPGVYELRRKSTGELILFGQGGNVAYRMTSLLPAPLGAGKRNNAYKRNEIFEYLADIEYRTMACATVEDAKQIEQGLKLHSWQYKYRT